MRQGFGLPPITRMVVSTSGTIGPKYAVLTRPRVKRSGNTVNRRSYCTDTVPHLLYTTVESFWGILLPAVMRKSFAWTRTPGVSWRFKTAPEGAGGSVWGSPAIDEEEHIVYNVTGSAKAFMPPGPMLYTESIVAHDLESGELLWYSQARPRSPHDLDFGCHPMIFDAKAPAGYRGNVVRNCVAAGSKGAFSPGTVTRVNFIGK